MARLRIGVDLGMSIQVQGVDWLKPTVRAELDFDEVPDEDELKEKWKWLWDSQVGPQGDELIDLLMRELSSRGISAKSKPKGETY